MDRGSNERLRVVIGVVLPLGLLVGSLIPLVLWWDRLPIAVATRWGLNGRPVSSMPIDMYVGFTLLVGGIGWLLCWMAVHNEQASADAIGNRVWTGTGVSALNAMLAWQVCTLNLDVAHWREAGELTFPEFLVLMGFPIGFGFVTSVVSRRLGLPERSSSMPHSTSLPGEPALWVGTARSRWALPMILVGAGAGAWLAASDVLVAGVIVAVSGLAAAWYTSVRVEIDRTGVTVHYGRMPWPVTHYPMREIEWAAAIYVRPSEWGGWGHRMSWSGGSAIVLRAGPGLELRLSGDRRRVITVDDPITGAEVISQRIGRVAPSKP